MLPLAVLVHAGSEGRLALQLYCVWAYERRLEVTYERVPEEVEEELVLAPAGLLRLNPYSLSFVQHKAGVQGRAHAGHDSKRRSDVEH
jgi:hypothetical protein